MNLTLESLRILDAIDRKGSFAAAALALDRVPSALTYSVRKLEEDLDVLLFDRRGHRAKLTPAGQELLTEGRNLLRAADELEQRVKRTATGWEAELRIVMDSIIPFDAVLPLIHAFDQSGAGTRLRFRHEVLSGVWEALADGSADLAIGAAYDGPDAVRMTGEFRSRPLGAIEWVFAVAPSHPLAHVPEPLPTNIIQAHRAVAVGDTGRTLPGITAGLLSGQATLTVPSLQAKLAAQLAGLGCGHLPLPLAAAHLKSGALIEKQTMDPRPAGSTQIAWRARQVAEMVSRTAGRTVRAAHAAGARMNTHCSYVGRFAPSPTGPLHAGSLVAAMASYLDARAHDGRWLVRIEDIDEARSVPGAAKAILQALAACGMQWDGEVLWQSRRKERYRQAFDQLSGHVYACGCSRREIADSRVRLGPDGAAIYPGACRHGLAAGKTPRAWRLRVPDAGMPDECISFEDRWLGTVTQHLAAEVGDFVLKRADGFWAYQLAVVVDDADQGVTHVVRGADLLDSTARQIYLQRLLHLPTPRYLHVPVVTNAAGEKLSKQTGAAPFDAARPLIALQDAGRFLGLPAAHVDSLDAFWRHAIQAWALQIGENGSI